MGTVKTQDDGSSCGEDVVPYSKEFSKEDVVHKL